MKKFAFSFTAALIAAYLALSAAAAAVEHVTAGAETQQRLKEIIAGDHRSDRHKARDKYRHPFETLSFIGIEPDLTVVEIWPGGQGGWYRAIIEPLLKDRGTYIPVRSGSDFPGTLDFVPYGEVDMVLVFRAHGFMIYSNPAQTYIDALYAMLRPGGIFAIVDHAGDENVPQDPDGGNGYVNESHLKMMAEKAGFKLLASSDVNRNPADNKDHPRGVYSLPPSLSGSSFDDDARAEFLKIGESDRFTLKFYKPEE